MSDDCAPPGTEPVDIVENRSEAQRKAEDEIEVHTLSATVKLDDGSIAKVFSRSLRNRAGFYMYSCLLCGAYNLAGERDFQMHIGGKKHQHKMAQSEHSAQQYYQPNKKRKGIEVDSTCKPDMTLAPGEPVPPGFEGEVKGVATLQATLDSSIGPLIGLEYLLELITHHSHKEPQYICLLCDKRGDPRTVMAHLYSYNHRLNYLEIHYPSVFKGLFEYRVSKAYRKVLVAIVQNVCEAIEKTHGRATASVCDQDTFERNKDKYFKEASREKHHNERVGPNFLDLIDKNHIEKNIIDQLKETDGEEVMNLVEKKKSPSPPVIPIPERKVKPDDEKPDRKSFDSISSISSSSLGSKSRSCSRERLPSQSKLDLPNNRREVNYRRRSRSFSRSRSRSTERLKRYQRRSRSPSSRNPYKYEDPYRRMQRTPWSRNYNKRNVTSTYDNRVSYKKQNYESSIKPSNEVKRKLIPTPKELAQQASEISVQRYKSDKYRFALEIVETEMEKSLKHHEKNPEKHPLYPEEWKKFWNRRYKELQAEKKDPSNHDFKPEWIEFWTTRMKELHNEELEEKKLKLREKYEIQDDPENKVTTLKEQYHIQIKKKEEPTEVIVIDDDKGSVRSNKRSVSIDKHSIRSHSPWDDDDYVRPKIQKTSSRDREERVKEKTYEDWAKEYYGPKRNKPVFIREKHGTNRGTILTQSPYDDTEPLNIVAVLRLLTALEDLLGSLGPKIIEMLSKALAMDKMEANSAEDLLLNEVNSVLLETVKEKLKGQLFAGMLDALKVTPVKTAIQKIAALLHQASEKAKAKLAEEVKTNAKLKLAPVTVPGVGAVEKAAIAKQIAAALVAQGKTDVTTDDLEHLINAVVGMAKASTSSDKPITTATYLAQQASLEASKAMISNLTKGNIAAKPAMPTRNSYESKNNEPVAETAGMDGLSDSDLKTLLQNFSNLSTDEQHGLIMYLKKLEAREPERVEKLRKFVNLGGTENPLPEKSYSSGRVSPFSIREGIQNPTVEERDQMFEDSILPEVQKSEPMQTKLLDSEDEDYSFDDVFKAASQNVKEKQLEKDMKLVQESIMREREESNSALMPENISIADAKTLIANLMDSLQKNVAEMGAGSSTNIPAVGSSQTVSKSVTPLSANQDSNYSQNSNSGTQNPKPFSNIGTDFDLSQLTQIDFEQFKNPTVDYNNVPERYYSSEVAAQDHQQVEYENYDYYQNQNQSQNQNQPLNNRPVNSEPKQFNNYSSANYDSRPMGRNEAYLQNMPPAFDMNGPPIMDDQRFGTAPMDYRQNMNNRYSGNQHYQGNQYMQNNRGNYY